MQENEILKLILNQTCIGYWDWRIKENTAILSNNFLSFFGYKEGELFPAGDGLSHLHKIILPDDIIPFENIFNQFINNISSAETLETEVRYYHRNGTIIWTAIKACIVERDENNKPARIVGSHTDISKDKEHNQQLLKEYKVFKIILDDLPQSIYWRDKNHKYLGCNLAFAKSLRQESTAQVVDKTNHDFKHLSTADIELYHNEDNEVLSNAKSRLHFIGQIDNNEGKKIWVDSSKVPLKDDKGVPYAVLGIFNDITEHEQIKLELTRINKLYNTLSRINEIMHNISSKEDLYSKVCSILTQVGGFRLATIGELRENELYFPAISGNPVSYIQNLDIKLDNSPNGNGPIAKSIKEQNVFIVNDFLKDNNTIPWHQSAAEADLNSCATFPIKFKGNIIGMIGVYSNEINYFQNKEVVLLEEVAMLVSFGLDELDKEEERKIAEKKIKQLADIIEYSSTFVAISTPDGKDVYKNNSFKKALDIEGEDVTQFHFNDFHTPKAQTIVASVIQEIMEKGIATFENELISKKGQIIPVLQTIMLHKNDNNQPEFLSTTAIDITNLKKKEEELTKLASDLRSLSNHLISIREEERKIIAKEIHDELGQNLAILKMDASWISTHLDGDKGKMQDKIKQFNEITEETVKTSRRLYNSLYPQMIDDIGLLDAIKWHASKYYENNDLNFQFNSVLDEVKFSSENNNTSLVLFRIYQECLTNIMRHANACNVEISLFLENGCIKMIVQDDGKGFIPDEVDTMMHHGLMGMKERVMALDGTILIQSEPGKGTSTSVSIPIV